MNGPRILFNEAHKSLGMHASRPCPNVTLYLQRFTQTISEFPSKNRRKRERERKLNEFRDCRSIVRKLAIQNLYWGPKRTKNFQSEWSPLSYTFPFVIVYRMNGWKEHNQH